MRITDFTPELDRLIIDMIETMYAAPVIGLAAPQVGVQLRGFVIDLVVGLPRWRSGRVYGSLILHSLINLFGR